MIRPLVVWGISQTCCQKLLLEVRAVWKTVPWNCSLANSGTYTPTLPSFLRVWNMTWITTWHCCSFRETGLTFACVLIYFSTHSVSAWFISTAFLNLWFLSPQSFSPWTQPYQALGFMEVGQIARTAFQLVQLTIKVLRESDLASWDSGMTLGPCSPNNIFLTPHQLGT